MHDQAKQVLRTALWDYDRTRPLIEGGVKVDGYELAIAVQRPEEIFRRAFSAAEFDLCELSFSNSLTAISKGDFPYLLLPAFLARAFRHSSIVIRTDRGIASPTDLRGKTIGLQEYGMTAAVVIRGVLRDYGIAPEDIRWRVGEKGLSRPLEFPAGAPPEGVEIETLSADVSLEDRLLAGELDAAFLVRRPSSLDQPAAGIARLFQDPKVAEQEWFSRSKIFPIMHAVGIRKTLVEADLNLPRRLFDAFDQARMAAIAELEVTQAPKVTLPWPHSAVDEARALMGHEFWPYGIRANRHVLEAQIRWSYLDGLQKRPVALEEMFAEGCLDT